MHSFLPRERRMTGNGFCCCPPSPATLLVGLPADKNRTDGPSLLQLLDGVDGGLPEDLAALWRAFSRLQEALPSLNMKSRAAAFE